MNVQSELVSVALLGRFLCRLFGLHGCAMIEYMVCFVGFVCGDCWREGLGGIFGHSKVPMTPWLSMRRRSMFRR